MEVEGESEEESVEENTQNDPEDTFDGHGDDEKGNRMVREDRNAWENSKGNNICGTDEVMELIPYPKGFSSRAKSTCCHVQCSLNSTGR